MGDLGGNHGDRRPNRLAGETSPYLLQHAHNPVDWYPWGPEALERAKAEDKPILLSIGYAACHWCHVMERESFEDESIAELMNAGFVPVKVDREERPDLDAIYMDAVQALTGGHGGWPMTVFLTPEGAPFYGGTYYPPDDRMGMPGFRRVLQSVAAAWEHSRDDVAARGQELVSALTRAGTPPGSSSPLTPELFATAVMSMGRTFDARHGGFGTAPKFPQPPMLEALIRGAAKGLPGAKDQVESTLRHMAMGGIYDQLGGGFHRYSVDRQWLVPHFEKMLYDNAQLARVYTHAWQAWKVPLYRRIAVETLEYLVRDMLEPGGGFASSEDADSEGEEGTFYVWSYEELTRLAPGAAGYYGATERGNFEGRNILTASSDVPPADARARLLEARSRRPRPAKDDKVLVSWNGLTIAALAEAGAAFARPDLVDRARETASFLLANARDPGGRLLHSWRAGRATVLGLLEDYAFLADGLLSLWEVTFDPRWFEEARRLAAEMTDLFADPGGPGFFTTGSDHEQLLVRQQEVIESVTPAPMAVASLVLQRLGLLTGDDALRTRGAAVVDAGKGVIERAPQAAASFLSALDLHLSTPKEIVVLGGPDDPGTRALTGEVWTRYLPNKVVAGAPPGIDSPLLEGKASLDGRPTAFVCEHFACRAPTTDPNVLARQLA
ncbi:MAG: thioredoxin domain-containing protein [Actinomycetota bacterium]